MANAGTGAVKIIDNDNDVVTVTNNKLDVNAYLNATPAIDIGDVSLLLGGTAADTNNGTAGAQTLRVTIASDTTGVLSIDDNGGSITVDSTAFTGMITELERINTAIFGEDDAHSSGQRGVHLLSVRRDQNATTSGADGDYSSLTTDGTGCLWVRPRANFAIDTFAMIDVDNASEILSDTVGVENQAVEIFLQADESNTGYVMVGDADVADNRGMKLNPGDTLILNVGDTRFVRLWASADNQNVRCMLTRSV